MPLLRLRGRFHALAAGLLLAAVAYSHASGLEEGRSLVRAERHRAAEGAKVKGTKCEYPGRRKNNPNYSKVPTGNAFLRECRDCLQKSEKIRSWYESHCRFVGVPYLYVASPGLKLHGHWNRETKPVQNNRNFLAAANQDINNAAYDLLNKWPLSAEYETITTAKPEHGRRPQYPTCADITGNNDMGNVKLGPTMLAKAACAELDKAPGKHKAEEDAIGRAVWGAAFRKDPRKEEPSYNCHGENDEEFGNVVSKEAKTGKALGQGKGFSKKYRRAIVETPKVGNDNWRPGDPGQKNDKYWQCDQEDAVRKKYVTWRSVKFGKNWENKWIELRKERRAAARKAEDERKQKEEDERKQKEEDERKKKAAEAERAKNKNRHNWGENEDNCKDIKQMRSEAGSGCSEEHKVGVKRASHQVQLQCEKRMAKESKGLGGPVVDQSEDCLDEVKQQIHQFCLRQNCYDFCVGQMCPRAQEQFTPPYILK